MVINVYARTTVEIAPFLMGIATSTIATGDAPSGHPMPL
jgi:hypothetical protein